MYSTMLVHDKFTVPMSKRGSFATISQQELDAMPFFKYGIYIYKCRVTNPHNVSTRLFHYSERKSCHTHFSLTHARERAWVVHHNGGRKRDNVLLCPDGRLHGIKLFSPIVQQMMSVYEDVETKKHCKRTMNCLWGGLTMLNNNNTRSWN